MWRVFLSLHKTSDKEYGTSQPPSTLQNLRCGNYWYDDTHLGNTRNYIVLQTQRLQIPNEGRTQRQCRTRHQKGSLVRKQTQRTTILLHFRIIILPLLTNIIISLVFEPRPQSQQGWGQLFFPKHSPEKNFRKFFYFNHSPKVTSLRISGAKNYDSFQVTFFYIFGAKNYVFLGRTFFYFYGAKNYGDKILFFEPK